MLKIKQTLAVAALAVITAAALPAMAADGAPAAQPAAPAAPHGRAADMVETRIKTLHDQLHITAAQADQWNAVAGVMRDNARSYAQLIKDESKNAATMTAVEDLRAYQKIAEAHAAGVGRLVAVFQPLYDTMSPEQKKTTDEVFRAHKHAKAH